MKKLYLYGVFLSWVFLSSSVFAGNQAVEIMIGGQGPVVDGAAFQTVRQVIGNAVANGVVDNFIVSGYGKEGGFSACVQASPRTRGFVSFVQQLRTISPNPNTTAYSITPVVACAEAITFCTLDVNQCPDGLFVGRVPPSCEFAACPSK
ncbi:MAG: hypothetical protein PHR16_02220 [Methylovulum sp.]|nr:hypothetical protein [Methylovulum sp.]